MVNKFMKDSAVNNNLTHTETGVTRNIRATTKPEVFQHC